MIYLILGALLLALAFGPQMWVRHVMRSHSGDRPDFPGTGGELARHLLDEAGLHEVPVESVEAGDHYDPQKKVVRLSRANHDGRSLTAVAVAAHEVAHAVQDAQGYQLLHVRNRLAQHAIVIQRIGSIVLMASPLIAIVTRMPSLTLLQIGVGLLIMASSVVIHLITLPVELDASFRRALPALAYGKYLDEDDLRPARKILQAAALTYVAAALRSLLDVLRWVRLLRF